MARNKCSQDRDATGSPGEPPVPAGWNQARGFVRIHRSYLINLDRVREIRLRGDHSNDWEVKLDPPVNAVLPVSRHYLAALRKVLRL